jgi:hypothetical protein
MGFLLASLEWLSDQLKHHWEFRKVPWENWMGFPLVWLS